MRPVLIIIIFFPLFIGSQLYALKRNSHNRFLSLANHSDFHWKEIKWKQKTSTIKKESSLKENTAWIRSSFLFDEWNFSEYAWTTQKTIPFYSDGTPALKHIIDKNTRLKIKKVIPTHIQIEKHNLWILRHLLVIFPDHWGYLISKHKTPLRKEALYEAEVIGHLPSGIKLTPLSFQKEFVQIEWNKQSRFIAFHDVISRLNFAKQVKVNQSWRDVLFIMDSWIKTNSGQFVSIDQIQGIKGGRSMAYVMASKAHIRQQPDMQSHILQTITQFSPLSLLEKKTISHPMAQRVITTDQLFERKLFDVTSKTDSMWASAKGIFRSFDGHFWEKITFFKDQDFPLVFSPAGNLYVGPYRSIDHGKTFQQYIRWDLVFDALKKKNIHTVSNLSIKDIEFLNSRNDKALRMTLQIGRDWAKKTRSTKVISYDEGASWHPN